MQNGAGVVIGLIGVIAIVVLIVIMFLRIVGPAEAQTTSHVWVVVLHFNVGGIHAAVLPRDHPYAYDEDGACKRIIPTIKRRWERLELPMPDKITCERYEVR